MCASSSPGNLKRRTFLARAAVAPALGATLVSGAPTPAKANSATPYRFETRAGFIDWIGQGGTASGGTVAIAGPSWFRAAAGATAIPDAPGWLPALPQAQMSCWADTTRGHQAAWDWSHAGGGAPLLLDYDLAVTGTEYWGDLTLIDGGGSITSHADAAFRISQGAGYWGKSACILTRSANGNTDYGEPLESRYRMHIGTPAQPIRWVFDKSDPAKPRFPVRFIGLRDFSVAIEITGTSTNPGGQKFEHAPPDFYFFNQDGHIFIRSTFYNEQATNGGLWIRDINLGGRGPDFATRNLTLDIEAYDETPDETVAIFTTFSGRYRYLAAAGQKDFRGPDRSDKSMTLHRARRTIVRLNDILLREGEDYTLDHETDTVRLTPPAARDDRLVVLSATPGYLKNIRGRIVARSKQQLAFNVINNAEMAPEWLSGHLDVFAISDNARNNQGVFVTRAPTDFTYGTVHVDINGAAAGAKRVQGALFKQTNSLAAPDKPVRVNDLIVRINGQLACGDGIVDMVYGGVDADSVITCSSGSRPATSMKNNLTGRMRGGDLCDGTEFCAFRVNEITGGTFRGRIGNSNVKGEAVTILWDTQAWSSIYTTNTADPGFAHDGPYRFAAHVIARGDAAPGRAIDSAAADRSLSADYTLDITRAGGPPHPDRLAGPVRDHRLHLIDEAGGTTLTLSNGLVLDGRGRWTPGLQFGGSDEGIAYVARSGHWRIAAGVLHYEITLDLSVGKTGSGPATITLPEWLPGTQGPGPHGGVGMITDYTGMAGLASPVARIRRDGDQVRLALHNQGPGSTEALTEANFSRDTRLGIAGSAILG